MFLLDVIFFFSLVMIALKKNLSVGFIAITELLIYSIIIHNPISEPSLYISLVILSIVTATSSLSAAGGIIYISEVIERIIVKHKSFIEIIAPIFTFIATIICGTPYIALAIIPIATKISIEENIKPVYSITGCIIAANHGYLCSPIGSPFIVLSHILKINRYYILFTLITSCFIGLLFAIIYNFVRQKLNIRKSQQNTYNENVKNEVIDYDKSKAKKAVFLFLIGLVVMFVYGLNDNIKPYIIKNGQLTRSEVTILIPLFMFSIAFIINYFCAIDMNDILKQKTMEYGLKSTITIIGISWLSNTLIENNKSFFLSAIRDNFDGNLILLGIILFFAAVFIASQTAAILIFVPIYLSIGIDNFSILKIIPFADGLFFIPLTAIFSFAIECDITKSTKSGKYVLNHSLMIPGIIATVISATSMFYLIHLTEYLI